MAGNLWMALGSGVGAFITIYLAFKYGPKLEKWLKEWEPFKKRKKV